MIKRYGHMVYVTSMNVYGVGASKWLSVERCGGFCVEVSCDFYSIVGVT